MFQGYTVSAKQLLMRGRSNQHQPLGRKSDQTLAGSVQEYKESGRKTLR